jgi:Family of unknown function (DUF6011)
MTMTDIDMMTGAQQDFARRLMTRRWQGLGLASYEDAVAALSLDRLSKRDGSRLIDRLMGLPEDPDTTMPEVVARSAKKGVNSRAGRCKGCGHVVEAGAGFYFGTRGAWLIHHKVGECSTEPVAVASIGYPSPPTEGVYMVADKYVLVYKTGHARHAAKAWNGRRFVYQRGLIYEVAATGRPVTAEEAAAFGKDTGHCCACARTLTDDRSVSVGYGPVCAAKYGWPWGA